MILNKEVLFKYVVICLIFISFFLGYFLRENAVGGGPEFYNLTWPITQSFKKDFLFTIKNYGSFRDYTIPFSHILNAYINPFSNDIENFQLSITIISFAIFLIFALVFKKTFKHTNFVDSLLISSLILLLPFFRTSAFWGKNENYGWLFFILALYFFSEIKKDISKNPSNQSISNVILFCFTSACALYARQALAFLPISYLLYLFFYNANKKIVITSIISFAVFAIPAFLLILIWGNVFDLEIGGLYRHIGTYGFRRESLFEFTMLEPSERELDRSLEQMRALDNGIPIRALVTKCDHWAVDTPKDLEIVADMIGKMDNNSVERET